MNKIKRNARFNFFYKNTVVKLTMKPGDRLNFGFSEPSEEGYHYEDHTFEYPSDENVIYRQSNSGGRDCDGRIDYSCTLQCKLDNLKSHIGFEDIRFPLWDEIESSQRDEFAELMGY